MSSPSFRPRAPSASSLPPPAASTLDSHDMGSPLAHTQTEPALSAATNDFDVGRAVPTTQSSTDTVVGSPQRQQHYGDHLTTGGSSEPVEGEELARTTTSSSGFSTQSGNGGVEIGSKRDREWRDHFDLNEDEELVDSEWPYHQGRGPVVSSTLTTPLDPDHLSLPFSPPSSSATGCALAKEILVHGRIFISTHSVGFKANILGFKTKVSRARSHPGGRRRGPERAPNAR